MIKVTIAAIAILAAAAPDGCSPEINREYPGTPVAGPPRPTGCVSPTYWGTEYTMFGYPTSFNVPPCPEYHTRPFSTAGITWTLFDPTFCIYEGTVSGHPIYPPQFTTTTQLVTLPGDLLPGNQWCTPFQWVSSVIIENKECKYRYTACQPDIAAAVIEENQNQEESDSGFSVEMPKEEELLRDGDVPEPLHQ
jgi:hypothetical protein